MTKIHAYITGTSSGIGHSLANHLLSENTENRVTGIGRRQTIHKAGYTHHTADFTNPAEASQIDFGNVQPSKENIIVLVNNAGVITPINHVGRLKPNDMIGHMNVNLVAPVVLTNLFIGHFNDHPGPKLIINVSSGAATSPYDGWSCYCSSKAGLEMFAKVVDAEQKINRLGFKIFSVSPGVIDTPMQDSIRNADKAGFSNVDKFVNLKDSNQLKSADKIAEKFSYIINHHDKQENVCLSF